MSISKLDAWAHGFKLHELFPNTKFNPQDNRLNKYQQRKLAAAIKAKVAASGVILEPDRPDIYDKAGFYVSRGLVYTKSEKFRIYECYHAEGESEYYSASFFGGVAHVQLIPLFELPEFLQRQAEIDEEEGKFYDLITLREGDRNAWGGEQLLSKAYDSAQDMLEYLMQYKRQGALIGEGGSFTYIQVVYIQLS